MDIVDLRRIKKQLKRIPNHVVDKILLWATNVERMGLREVRKILGYHDEPLKGKKKGATPIRLSKSYRAIYEENTDGFVNIVLVIEVNNHEY